MIECINPLHITEVYVKEFKRYGVHPMLYRLARARGWFWHWLVVRKHADSFDAVFPARVVIEGQTRVLKHITCRSNHAAYQLCDDINRQMNDYFREYQVLEKLRENV